MESYSPPMSLMPPPPMQFEPSAPEPMLVMPRVVIPGAKILKTAPYLHILFRSLKGLHCDSCLRRVSGLEICIGCHSMYYCDRMCRQRDHRFHKYECQFLAKNTLKPFETTDTERLLLRLFLVMIMDQEFSVTEFLLYDNRIRLMDIINKVNLPKLLESYPRNFQIFKEFYAIEQNFKAMGIPDVENYEEHLLRLLMIIKGPIAQRIDWAECEVGTSRDYVMNAGFGLYPQLSAVQHSCLPNAAIVMKGKILYLRAMQPMPKNGIIARTYIDLSYDKITRNAILKTNFGFECNCFKCETELYSNVDYRKIRELTNNYDLKEFLFRYWNKKFTPDDFIAAENLINSGKFEEMIATWKLIYPYYYYPDVSEYIVCCISYMCFHKENAVLSPIALYSIRQMLELVTEMVKITHGSKHPIYKRDIASLEAITVLPLYQVHVTTPGISDMSL